MAECMIFSIHGIRPGGEKIELLDKGKTERHAVPTIPQVSLNVNCGHTAMSSENWSRLQEHMKKQLLDPTPVIIILKSPQWPTFTIKSNISQPVIQPTPAATHQPIKMIGETQCILVTLEKFWSLLASDKTSHMVGKRLFLIIVPKY